LEDSTYCDACGARLSTAGAAPAVAESGAAEPGGTDLAASAEERAPSSPAGGGVPPSVVRPRAKVVVVRGGRVGREFPVTDAEAMIGRWDAERGIFPEIDLDEEDPDAKVSRRHARIFYKDGRFWIEDLGSLNGTFVNRGPRLGPGQAVPLRHGDEIIVGKTFLRFLIEGV
jgi:serine/threonine-protein kinase